MYLGMCNVLVDLKGFVHLIFNFNRRMLCSGLEM